jgi:subtilisin family serine protease
MKKTLKCYGNITGISMATPQVAGVIALMYAEMPQSMIQAYKINPANFALSVKQYLLLTSTMRHPKNYSKNFGQTTAQLIFVLG